MGRSLARFIATVGPLGHSPIAPGTMGTLAAIPIVLFLGGQTTLFMVCITLTIVGIWAAGETARDLRQHDPQIVVIDEVCGMLTAMLFVPVTWPRILTAFLAFRFFDVLKPPPVRQLERLPGGFGIVLDDLMAGGYAWLVVQAGIHYAHL